MYFAVFSLRHHAQFHFEYALAKILGDYYFDLCFEAVVNGFEESMYSVFDLYLWASYF